MISRKLPVMLSPNNENLPPCWQSYCEALFWVNALTMLMSVNAWNSSDRGHLKVSSTRNSRVSNDVDLLVDDWEVEDDFDVVAVVVLMDEDDKAVFVFVEVEEFFVGKMRPWENSSLSKRTYSPSFSRIRGSPLTFIISFNLSPLDFSTENVMVTSWISFSSDKFGTSNPPSNFVRFSPVRIEPSHLPSICHSYYKINQKIDSFAWTLWSLFLTRKTSLALRLFADASPSHFFSSFTSQINCSSSTLRPTKSSFNLSFDHCVAFFSFQCQLFGFVAE